MGFIGWMPLTHCFQMATEGPAIFNTDQGSQFTGDSLHRRARRRHEIAISMDGKGAWRDNVFVERLWRTVKYEEVYLHGLRQRTRRARLDRAVSRSLQSPPPALEP